MSNGQVEHQWADGFVFRSQDFKLRGTRQRPRSARNKGHPRYLWVQLGEQHVPLLNSGPHELWVVRLHLGKVDDPQLIHVENTDAACVRLPFGDSTLY